MTKDELITKQQLEIEGYKKALAKNKEIAHDLFGQFYSIGAPLNDNVLQFNREQRMWCYEVFNLIEQLRTESETD